MTSLMKVLMAQVYTLKILSTHQFHLLLVNVMHKEKVAQRWVNPTTSPPARLVQAPVLL